MTGVHDTLRIRVGDELRSTCPEFVGRAVLADVVNSSFCPALWQMIESFAVQYRKQYTIDAIKDIPSIQATRLAYRRCGKDPSRYRPSGEALCRRILRGLPLCQIDTLVDLINVVSIRYGYSIGGFDAGKIEGNELTLGIGRVGEPYLGIGRGELNIEGMPVYRDAVGGIGTPTSDHERTKLTVQTTRLLAIINGYSGPDGIDEATACMLQLLRQYASACNETIISF